VAPETNIDVRIPKLTLLDRVILHCAA